MTAKLQCRHCPASTYSSPEVARALGWRLWSGTTIGGNRAEDVVCAACAGNAKPGEGGWRARCRTCDWSSDEDRDTGTDDWTAADARYVARDHQCEKRVEIAPAAGDGWFDPYDVNDDGTLRRPLADVR